MNGRRWLSGPTLGFTCAAGGRVKRDTRRHAPRTKNAPGLGPRQRRQVRAMLGGLATSVYLLCASQRHFLMFSVTTCSPPQRSWQRIIRNAPRLESPAQLHNESYATLLSALFGTSRYIVERPFSGPCPVCPVPARADTP